MFTFHGIAKNEVNKLKSKVFGEPNGSRAKFKNAAIRVTLRVAFAVHNLLRRNPVYTAGLCAGIAAGLLSTPTIGAAVFVGFVLSDSVNMAIGFFRLRQDIKAERDNEPMVFDQYDKLEKRATRARRFTAVALQQGGWRRAILLHVKGGPMPKSFDVMRHYPKWPRLKSNMRKARNVPDLV